MDFGKCFGRNLAKNQNTQSGYPGSNGNGCFTHVLVGEHRDVRGHEQIDDVVAHQDGGQHVIGFFQPIFLQRAGPALFFIDELPCFCFRQRG